MTALLEYINFSQVLKRAHVTSINPFLRDECKLYQLLCCVVHYIAHSFCPATLNGVLAIESCCKLRRLNFTRGVLNPLEPPSLRRCVVIRYKHLHGHEESMLKFNRRLKRK